MDLIIPNLNYISFIICALIGGVTHYLKKFLKGETQVPFYDWFGKANINATVYSFIVFTFIIIGTIASGVITADMNFWAAMYSGFMTGFAIDSGVNSDGKTINRDILEVHTTIKQIQQLGEDQPQEHPESIFNASNPSQPSSPTRRPLFPPPQDGQ